IDGYFERQPAVWHKEILGAMSRGIHVFGAASMGALRAAELEVFGMEGVGSIFEAYRTGALEDDDEVAVAQAPAELGFRALSDAMVDIRHTLELAVEASVLTAPIAAALESIAKALFYPDRRYSRVLQAAVARVLAIKHSYVQGLAQGGPQRVLAERRLWSHHKVTSGDDRRRWMKANNVDDARMQGLLEDEARVGWITNLAAL